MMFTLEQAKQAILNKPEFSLNKREFGYVIDYNFVQRDTFIGDSPEQTRILQNLRGTCFNEEGKIIRLCYHKFHNLNENAEYKEEAIAQATKGVSYTVEQKLDGSMIAPIPMPDGSWKFGTRAGVTEVAAKAQAFYESMPFNQRHDYRVYIERTMKAGATPIFEYCARDQRIVIDYEKPALVLTDVRYHDTGEYVRLWRSAVLPLMEVGKVINTDQSSLSELAEFVKGLTDDEGIVIKYANGLFVKIKADEYVLKHRALDGLRYEKSVAALILHDLLDDVLPIVDEKLRERLVNYRASLWQNIQKQEEKLHAAWDSIQHLSGNRAEFAREASKHEFRQFLFKMLDGKKVSLREYALLKTGSNAGVEENRWLFGKPYLEF